MPTIDKIDIGSTPAEEPCAALGKTEDFEKLNLIECRAYSWAIQAVYGAAPPGSNFIIRRNEHDYGVYREVAYRYDLGDPRHREYAEKVENGLATWAEADMRAPVLYGSKSQAISVVDDVEKLDRTHHPADPHTVTSQA